MGKTVLDFLVVDAFKHTRTGRMKARRQRPRKSGPRTGPSGIARLNLVRKQAQEFLRLVDRARKKALKTR